MTERAPAKVNVSLALGPTRPDGRHELDTVMDALELGDELTLDLHAGTGADEVVCPGVVGPNLAAAALEAFRAATGWAAPPVRLTIAKRVPVAAGMGGGSSDAAATLRLAMRASGLADERLLLELAAGLGSDVPGLVRPGRVRATGAGERVERLPPPAPYGLLVLPSRAALSTGAVYAEADRLGLPRATLPAEPEEWVNDLQDAARSLEPSIDAALGAVRAQGAERALVAGSGPTVVGVFASTEGARRAAERLVAEGWDAPEPIVTRPLVGHHGSPS